MEKLIGYCGIVCSDCPVLVATRKDDAAERKRIAEMFTKQYGTEYKTGDINCDGCTGDSIRVFKYCNICEMRKCGREKKLVNCAYCSEYPCEKLTELFSKYSKAKETLSAIRSEHGIK
jgi:hypothetical protein